MQLSTLKCLKLVTQYSILPPLKSVFHKYCNKGMMLRSGKRPRVSSPCKLSLIEPNAFNRIAKIF